jgi:hypothetical protein
MANYEAKPWSEMPVHSGLRKASLSEELAYRRKRTFSKSCDDGLIDSDGIDARVRARSMFLGDGVGTLSAFRHCRISHCLHPEHVHRMIMDSIERHPLDAEREDDHFSDPFGIESERPTEISFSRKTRSSKRTEMNFEVFISINIHTVALS